MLWQLWYRPNEVSPNVKYIYIYTSIKNTPCNLNRMPNFLTVLLPRLKAVVRSGISRGKADELLTTMKWAGGGGLKQNRLWVWGVEEGPHVPRPCPLDLSGYYPDLSWCGNKFLVIYRRNWYLCNFSVGAVFVLPLTSPKLSPHTHIYSDPVCLWQNKNVHAIIVSGHNNRPFWLIHSWMCALVFLCTVRVVMCIYLHISAPHNIRNIDHWEH